jgi:phage gp36-like protein
MYLTPKELTGHLHANVIESITQGNECIVTDAIDAAIEEVRSYLKSRYDTDRVFAAEGTHRNALILEYTKVITVWNIIKLSNAETIYDMWEGRYDRAIKYLSGVAKGINTPSLPLLSDNKGDVRIRPVFGSNPKFHHSL